MGRSEPLIAAPRNRMQSPATYASRPSRGGTPNRTSEPSACDSMARHCRVVGVQDGKVLGALVAQDPRFRLRVLLEAPVPVQVVRRNVEHGRDMTTERVGSLELKAR